MAETKRWPYSPNKNQQEHDSSSIAVPRYVQQQFSKLDDISEVNAEEFTREDLLDREKREREIRELKKVVNSDEDVYVHMSLSFRRSDPYLFDLITVRVDCQNHPLVDEHFEWDYSRVQEKTHLHHNLGVISMFDELVLHIIKGHRTPQDNKVDGEEEEEILDVIPVPVVCIDLERPAPLNIFNYGLEISIVFYAIPLTETPPIEMYNKNKVSSSTYCAPVDGALRVPVNTTVQDDRRLCSPMADGKKHIVSDMLTASENTKNMHQSKSIWSIRASTLLMLVHKVMETVERGEARVRSLIRTLKRVSTYLLNTNRLVMLQVSHLSKETFTLIEFVCSFAFHTSLEVSEEMQLLLLDGLSLISHAVQQEYHRSVRPYLRSIVHRSLPYVKFALPMIAPILKRPMQLINTVSDRLENANIPFVALAREAATEVRGMYDECKEESEDDTLAFYQKHAL